MAQQILDWTISATGWNPDGSNVYRAFIATRSVGDELQNHTSRVTAPAALDEAAFWAAVTADLPG